MAHLKEKICLPVGSTSEYGICISMEINHGKPLINIDPLLHVY